MLLSFQNISKSFGGQDIVINASGKIEDKERIALVGANGVGKTTLLKMLTGLEYADQGSVSTQKGVRIGFLMQDRGLNEQNTVQEELEDAFSYVRSVEKRLNEALNAITNGGGEEAEKTFSRLTEEFEHLDGYSIEFRTDSAVNGLNLGHIPRQTPVKSLSGGEKTRLALCKLILSSPDLLILDEPTNHLDFKAITWLEAFLSKYKGGLLIVSHDRYLLDRTVKTVWELEDKKLTSWKGNYTDYARLKQEEYTRLLKEYTKQQEEIARAEEFIAKNLVRTATTNAAKSRRNALEKMERAEKPKSFNKKMSLSLTFEQDPVKDVLKIQDLCLKIPGSEKVLCKNVSMQVRKGDKIAIIGDNGTGKTTLFKHIISAKQKNISNTLWGASTCLGVFEQEDTNLDKNASPLSFLHDKYPLRTELELRSALGKVLLSGDDVFKPISALSGGERAKLKFCLLSRQNGNVLLLDEPTNHLDLLSKESIDEALSSYEGTLLVISHDRYFLNKVPTHIAEMTSEGLKVYKGNYDRWLLQKEWEASEQKKEQPEKVVKEKTESAYEKGKQKRSESAKLRNRFKAVEGEISAIETDLKEAAAFLSDPANQSDYVALAEKCTQIEDMKNRLSELYEEWEALV